MMPVDVANMSAPPRIPSNASNFSELDRIDWEIYGRWTHTFGERLTVGVDWVAPETTPLGRSRVESDDPQPALLKAVAAVERRGSQVAVRLDGVLPRGRRTPSLEEIDFWEVDWDYTGGVFHSRSQAIRPWRSSELESRLEGGLSSRRRRRLGVRVVARDGRIGLLTLRA